MESKVRHIEPAVNVAGEPADTTFKDLLKLISGLLASTNSDAAKKQLGKLMEVEVGGCFFKCVVITDTNKSVYDEEYATSPRL